jgi:two-component system nitrate/nitrite response regulator NarL
VLVADPDAETRAVVGRFLGRVGLVALLARTGEEALQLVDHRRPAVVVLEIALPDLSGYEICHQLRNGYGPELPIVFLSAERTEPRDKIAGLLLGADDYVDKPFDVGELVSRIQRLVERSAASSAAHPPRPAAGVTLTPSEGRILHLLADGHGTKEIARRLSIAPKTVATHISNVMRKLDVASRTQAVIAAQRLGLVDLRGDASDGAGVEGAAPAHPR